MGRLSPGVGGTGLDDLDQNLKFPFKTARCYTELLRSALVILLVQIQVAA